jgi:hypothetical protein
MCETGKAAYGIDHSVRQSFFTLMQYLHHQGSLVCVLEVTGKKCLIITRLDKTVG